ncbi:hypothetical protein BC835DRAFT_1419040 [Cytidiella melzeri]|nr:hypothetical protein BC835DRAFT_1419040 [Cytidiella melzeri]
MTTITIPKTFAYHVVGETTVELAQGDLTVAAPSSSATSSHGKTPVLTLTVAHAAFPIYSDTVFGTVAGDERVYVFQPDLGEGVLGYAKLVLPEGVSEPNSEFSILQEQFEKILISHGLLDEGENPPPQGSVTIPSVSATHVLGKTTVDLTKGDLTLVTVAPYQPEHHPNTILVLTVGGAAFPLRPTTTFGTVADDERVYIFTPEIQDASLPAGGYVRLTLPDKSHGLTDAAQEKFEQILIDHGLLKTGVLAASDELSSSINDEAVVVAASIRKSTAGFLANNPPTETPLTHSATTHSVAASASSASTTIYNAAQSVSSAVSSAASTAGAFLSERITGGPPSEETKEAASTMRDVYQSVGNSANVVKDAVTTSVGDVVQNEVGKETRDVGGNLIGSVSNAGGAVGQIAEVGTGAVLASGGAKGAVGLTALPPAQEMATFTIEGQDDDGEWKDAVA